MFRAALDEAGPAPTVGEVIGRRAEAIWRAYGAGDPAVGEVLGSAQSDLTLDQVRTGIARQHGFAGWAAMLAERDRPVDPRFEAAADALVSGDEEALRGLLDATPALARARSPFGHHATLVHYVAANGVEISRQWQSPRNAVRLLRLLLEHGADPDATCDTYRGDRAQTPLCLLVSSTHPARAGVQGDLVAELCRAGARPDGLDGDGLPLWTAITFGYLAAVEALAGSGARLDILVFAAAAGDLALVERQLRQGPAGARIGAGGPVLDARDMVGYALIYSAGLGRIDAVRLLLAHGPDLGLTEPMFGGTALGAARYHGRADIEALLSTA
jgi:hypothetical protein